MSDPFSIGDMGMMDPMGLAFDVPAPSLPDDNGMAAANAGPGGLTATLAEIGLSSSGSPVGVFDGVASSFSGNMDVAAFSAEGLGGLPPLAPPPPSSGPEAFTPEAIAAPGPSTFSESGEAGFSTAAMSSEGVAGGLFALPAVEPPAPPMPSFAGVVTAPSELLDLQMALTPPEPSQEGFSGASDAPLVSPASSIGVLAGGEHSNMSLAMAQSISDRVWGPTAVPGSFSSGGHESSGRPSIQIQNLHLPATNPNQMLDQLLASAPDLTNADLSRIG